MPLLLIFPICILFLFFGSCYFPFPFPKSSTVHLNAVQISISITLHQRPKNPKQRKLYKEARLATAPKRREHENILCPFFPTIPI
ncbi:hypothetical protein B0T09DRAFT_328908 [Sordaria sp. MPI-SDFR-AT-0083]|nr:hypothetical protein B0T09DRAFT_328908 [Sordaria sp. MPI-SDFR-AT-0083]